MTFGRFALASVLHYRRPQAAVALGIAGAVAVLAGSLLVGSSVRGSLKAIASSRLGNTAVVAAAEQPFTEQLAGRLAAASSAQVTPLLSLTGVVRHESSSRRAGVLVYGVDARFFEFHGVSVAAPAPGDVLLSPDLAQELGVASGDAIVLRVPRVTDIPIDSLHGRRDETGRSIRLAAQGTLSREQLGSFSLAPGQGPVRAVFMSLTRLQRDLGLVGRVNTLLVAGNPAPDAARLRSLLPSVVTATDLGIRQEALTAGTAGAKAPASDSNAKAPASDSDAKAPASDPNAKAPASNLDATVVESASGLIADDIASKIASAASQTGRSATPVLTWLANRMTVGPRTIPYSLVAAIGPAAGGDARLVDLLKVDTGLPPPMVLNEWAARELNVSTGNAIEIEYFRWADEGRLVTVSAQFLITGIIPMTGLAIDRRLAPDYPGITNATNLGDWDPPFPIDLTIIRRQDEDYWDQYRTAPKALIALETGQKLWGTKHGKITSIRVSGVEPLNLDGLADPNGPVRVVDVRAQNLAASAGATDFGAYFSYFSFFLMVSALLLSALFFRLSVEQRLPQIGVMRASGFSLADVRRVLLMEGAIVTAAGAGTGVLLAIGWAKLMMLALTTLWVDAVGTTDLQLHVDAVSLSAGAIAAAAAGLISLLLTVRALSRSTPRSQIAGSLPASARRSSRRARWTAAIGLGGGVVLSSLAAFDVVPAAGGFFAGGALVLIGGLAAFRVWLAPDAARVQPLASLPRLGVRNAGWRPGRSLTAAGLVASAVFLLVAVDSFRKSVDADGGPRSGTGGFALIAESQMPVVHDLGTLEGRTAAGVEVPAGAALVPLRLRPGDDASCLNLYQPRQPRLLGVPNRLVAENRFRFARVTAEATDEQRANPWTMLGAADTDGRVPAIVDQTSLQYVLHAAVGDVITIDADTSRPIDLRIVASLDDSVLQGEILIGDAAFQQLFPQIAGYRAFLVDAGNANTTQIDELAASLEESLEGFGFDARSSAAQLAAFHRVENTYLSTFQALGGLGLVLGCLGLVAVVARNVFERRRELALLGAAGFSGRDLQSVVAIEHIAIVAAGLLVGLAGAAIAIAPVIIDRAGAPPWHALVWIVPVAVAGFGAAYLATRSVRKLPLLASLRSE